jgi:hypothetical protein
MFIVVIGHCVNQHLTHLDIYEFANENLCEMFIEGMVYAMWFFMRICLLLWRSYI